MKINHKVIITTLKVITSGAFLIALGYKLYNIYKYGGTQIQQSPTPETVNEYPDPTEDGEDIEPEPEVPYHEYTTIEKSNTYNKYND